MNIELQARLLKLKGFLNEINHISYSYSKIGKEIPYDQLNNETAKQVISVYENLLEQTKAVILKYKEVKK